MSEQQFELGPLQRMWINSLRAHPERQTKKTLGRGTPQNYSACCLGELHLCAHRRSHKRMPFSDMGNIFDGDPRSQSWILEDSWQEYGLKSQDGACNLSLTRKEDRARVYFLLRETGWSASLRNLNDCGMTWPEIADLVERNPKAFFARPV